MERLQNRKLLNLWTRLALRCCMMFQTCLLKDVASTHPCWRVKSMTSSGLQLRFSGSITSKLTLQGPAIPTNWLAILAIFFIEARRPARNFLDLVCVRCDTILWLCMQHCCICTHVKHVYCRREGNNCGGRWRAHNLQNFTEIYRILQNIMNLTESNRPPKRSKEFRRAPWNPNQWTLESFARDSLYGSLRGLLVTTRFQFKCTFYMFPQLKKKTVTSIQYRT